MNDWGQQDEQSNIEYRNNGLSNVYKTEDTGREQQEFYTIYNPNGSMSSRVLSAVAILAVIVFCGALFYFLYQDRSEPAAGGIVPSAQSKGER